MTVRFSTALRNNLAGLKGFGESFKNGVIHVYSGPQPLSADAPVSGTLLGVVTTGGLPFAFGTADNGLNFAPPSGGTIQKDADDVWSFTGLAAGTAGWFRFMANESDNLGQDADFNNPRMDGSCGVSGADLNISNIQVVVGAPNTVDVFALTIPAQ